MENKKQKLTQLQILFIKKVCFLLMAQLAVLLLVVFMVRRFMPNRLCLMTCGFWLDLLVFMAVAIVLILLSANREGPLVVRYTAFFGLAALMAYVMGVQYNQISMANKDDKKTAKTFFKALVIVVCVFIANLLILPVTLKHMSFIYALSTALTISLVGLILWGLFVGRGFLMWVSVSLLVFTGLLLTDLNKLVDGCKQNKESCDALDGASLIYLDLINILQDIFILLNSGQR